MRPTSTNTESGVAAFVMVGDGNGGYRFDQPPAGLTSSDSRPVALGDFDADGYTDLQFIPVSPAKQFQHLMVGIQPSE